VQDHTEPNTNPSPIPVQIGEPFHCWECGLPDQGGMYLIINHSPLAAYADSIYYMRLVCKHNARCARLGDAITPLRPLDRSIEENLACVRGTLFQLAKAVPPEKQNQDVVSKTIYLLVAGRISPQTAIDRLKGIMYASYHTHPSSQ
jgi:hypothetical protein